MSGKADRSHTQGKFIFALRQINLEVSGFLLKGRKRYYDIHDARYAWHKRDGRCADCGIVLYPYQATAISVRFVHRVPLTHGGRIDRENLMPVCKRCSDDRRRTRLAPELRVIDYNAMGDLLVNLVTAVVAKDERRVDYFKVEVDRALSEFVTQLHYIPVGLEIRRFQDPIDGQSTLADHVKTITEKISLLMEEVGTSKQYFVTRK